MTEEERDAVYDLIPSGMWIWGDDEERPHFSDADWEWWRNVLGHPKAHPGCCKTCGCATSCLLSVFYDAMISSVLRELDVRGLLRPASEAREVLPEPVPGEPE